MDQEQLDELESFVHEETESSRNTLHKWGMGLTAMALLSWIGWVSLGIIQASTDGISLRHLQNSLDQLITEHKDDHGQMREQFRMMDSRIDNMPPKDFRDRVDSMETKLDQMTNEFKQNAVEHTQILGTIGKIELNQNILLDAIKDLKATITKPGG